MPRLDARCSVGVPVTIMAGPAPSDAHPEAEIRNIGLSGALLAPFPEPAGRGLVRLKAHLPGVGDFEVDGKVLRRDEGGTAVKFVNSDRNSRWTLWQYIKPRLATGHSCPYCAADIAGNGERCPQCGLSVNLQSGEYFEIHEEERRRRWLQYIEEATEEFLERLKTLEMEIPAGPAAEDDAMIEAVGEVFDSFLLKAEMFEAGIGDREMIKQARTEFHVRTDPLLTKGYLFRRARTWPQGYQGDYKTLETIYEKNTGLSEGIGYYFDIISLESELGVAVRNRIQRLQEILAEELSERNAPSVLNIACGSCRELAGLVPEIVNSRARILCVDNDEDALSFSRERLSAAGLSDYVKFRKHNALKMFDQELTMAEFGRQDIIYSVGFFDYLPSDFLAKMLATLYSLLNPGGKLIAAFKDIRRYRPQVYHWITDWDGFLQRREEDFLEIFDNASIPREAITESREKSGTIIFYVIEAA